MNSITRTLLGTAVLYLTSFVPTASAQMSESLKFHLPVAAHFGSTEVPSGDYTIYQVKNTNGQPTLEVSSPKGEVHFFVQATRMEGAAPSTGTNVILTEQAGVYRVTKVEVAGSPQFYEIMSVENK